MPRHSRLNVSLVAQLFGTDPVAIVGMMTWYDDAMRTIIDLPTDQLSALDGICRAEAISRAEAIRRAVDLLVRDRAAGASRAAFGLWREKRPVDGLQYQQRLRAEWDAPATNRPTSRRSKPAR